MSLPRTGSRLLVYLVGLAATAATLLAPAPASALRPTQIGSFDQPVHLEDAPGKKNRKLLFVVEKPGRVMVVRGGSSRVFLDLTDLVLGPSSSEQGLLSIAFHPRYERNRLFYVYLTDKSGDNAVYEFKRSKKSRVRAIRGSRRLVLLIPHPDEATNHDGGQLQFGPDRLLYIAPGDGGSTPTSAQDPNLLTGKVLRIDPVKRQRSHCKKSDPPKCFGPPRPYLPKGAGIGAPEVYSLGLRNPFRFSFDAATGAIVIGDVGGADREEIDYRSRGTAAGVNFGWPRFEGTMLLLSSVQAPGAVPPIFEYGHAGGGCAVTGGYVIRDPRLSGLVGRYLYADFCIGDIRTFALGSPAATDASTGLNVPQLSSFGQGRRNVLFVVSLTGPVYRLDP